jgi:hypothetical protein
MSIKANDTYVKERVMSLTETYPLFYCHIKFKRSVIVTMHFFIFYHRLAGTMRNIRYSKEEIIDHSDVVKQSFDKVKYLYVAYSRSLDILRQEIDWLRTEQRSLEFRQSSSGQSPIKLIPDQGRRSVNFTTVT